MKKGEIYQWNKKYKHSELVEVLDILDDHALVKFKHGSKITTKHSSLWPLTIHALIDCLAKEKPNSMLTSIANKLTTDDQKEQFCKEIYWQMTESKAAQSDTFSNELKEMFNQYFK